jgi:hypothetical protein
MKYLILAATALIGLACSSHSQTIKSLGYDTTNGRVIYGGTNPLTFTNPLQFESGVRAATLTNLGLGTTNNVEFRRLKMIAANATDSGDDATLWLDTSGTNKYATMRLSGTGGSAEKYNAYLTAGPNGLNITATPGFRVLNGPTANAGSVLFGVNSSGNATLNGVNNTAPSQTASSASSLMTRDLLFRAQADDNSGDLVAMVGYTTSGGTGAVAAARDVFGASAQVSTNSNSVAGVYFADNIWANSTVSGAVVPSGKTIDLTMKGVNFRNLTNTSYVTRVVAGVGTPFRTIPAAGQDALSARGWGVNFFYNGTNHVFQPFWYTTSYNTGPETVVSNATANDSVFALRLRHEGPTTNGTISFWINDGLASRLSETPSFSTNVGDWNGNFGGRHYAIESATATNAAPAATTGIRVRAAYIKYDP